MYVCLPGTVEVLSHVCMYACMYVCMFVCLYVHVNTVKMIDRPHELQKRFCPLCRLSVIHEQCTRAFARLMYVHLCSLAPAKSYLADQESFRCEQAKYVCILFLAAITEADQSRGSQMVFNGSTPEGEDHSIDKLIGRTMYPVHLASYVEMIGKKAGQE